MTADEEPGASTVHCCEAAWSDRLGERRSIVVLPRDGVAAASYATSRLKWVGRLDGEPYLWGFYRESDHPDGRRLAEARRKAEKDIESRNVEISLSVPITASSAEAETWADATEAMLTVVGRTDAEWAAAEVRARRWWNALFAGQVRKRARRRYRYTMDTAARQYAEAVGDLSTRVRAEVVQAKQAARERHEALQREQQRQARASDERQAATRRRATEAIEAVDQHQVWLLLVEGETAYVKRSDVRPRASSQLPPADRRWSEPLTPHDLAYEIAYEKVANIVFDKAAVAATRQELNAGDVDADRWWDQHYQCAVKSVSEWEMRNRRGGYSSGSFI
ncbi:hypothetical protein [Micromonospora sp. NPDC049891]|uniref:hypothetical protein n=1 Tax=Micromonospora sp. NPDC049891 TaxID=3155655 RepID=UPI0033EADA91